MVRRQIRRHQEARDLEPGDRVRFASLLPRQGELYEWSLTGWQEACLEFCQPTHQRMKRASDLLPAPGRSDPFADLKGLSQCTTTLCAVKRIRE